MKTFFILILFLLLFSFFLPNLLSTDTGNKFLNYIVEKKTGIQIGTVNLSWTGPQIIKDLSFTKGTKRITLKELNFQKREFTLNDLDIWLIDHHIKGEKISLTIKEGASIPFLSFNFEKIQVPSMTLRLGKMVWQNFGAVKDLLSIIQLKIPLDADIPLWFQDAPLSITNGIIHLERTEFLLDNKYQFGVWNNINLAKQEFNLTFGIPQKTIQKVLDIHGLPKDYTIPMRFTGPFDNPSLHKSSAIKTMATLLLLQKLPLAPIPKVKPSPSSRPPFPWN